MTMKNERFPVDLRIVGSVLVLSVLVAAATGVLVRQSNAEPSAAAPASSQTLEKFVLFNEKPVMNRTEVGEPGPSHGEIISWGATFSEKRGGAVLGRCDGTQIVTHTLEQNADITHRMTTVEFDWENSDDSLVVAGSHPYPSDSLHSKTTISRVVIGGTGRFIGARGEIVSTPLPSGEYQHEITLVK